MPTNNEITTGTFMTPEDLLGYHIITQEDFIMKGTPLEEGYKHIITQEDLDNNPDMIDEGVKVGDIVYFDTEPRDLRDGLDYSQEILDEEE